MINLIKFIIADVQEYYYFKKFQIIQMSAWLQIWTYDRDNVKADREKARLNAAGIKLED